MRKRIFGLSLVLALVLALPAAVGAGAGAMPALGALRALEDFGGLTLGDRMRRALETAEAYSTGVRGPFHLMETTP